MSYRFRLMKNAGDHALKGPVKPIKKKGKDKETDTETDENADELALVPRIIKEGQVFSSNEPLHEMFDNKFELLSADTPTPEEEEDTDDLVDKSHLFPLAEEKGLEVWRSRTTKQYEIHDPETGEPVEGGTGLTKEEVNAYFAPPEEEVTEEAKPKTKKKKKKSKE